MAYKYMDKWQKLMIKKNDVSGVDMTPLSTYTSRFIHLLLDNGNMTKHGKFVFRYNYYCELYFNRKGR